MSGFLQGKVALVTGSTSGIGLTIAQSLAQNGAHILLNGFGSADEIAQLISHMRQHYQIQVHHNSADLTDRDQIHHMMDDACTRFDGIDILINNAGIQFVAALQDFPDEKWTQIINLNLNAAFYTTKAVIPMMRQRGWGRIINVASAHGLIASPFKSAYVAAKHGLVGLTKVTALENAEFNITANALCPGYVRTPLVDQQIAQQAITRGIPPERVIQDVLLKDQSTKQFVDVQDIADMTVFLCSTAGRSMTGSAIAIDGGWTAH